ncbi:ABC transporter substrate-binding protein [Paenibacillus allorhizosphaerae]|uniref:Extracellular solute-binding protein n=1 Tax=Paenibacillus allorhizosphaerae TaxID=2849866 RepID=A0ABM8VFA9_9BACL|nr:extracellular solute-binding protein [Paenibacillus allorhizosphaerae]CAG7634551.1 hypothetical protein PAECIP111802_02040 [Paenibacillus allorhizosphaerae]
MKHSACKFRTTRWLCLAVAMVSITGCAKDAGAPAQGTDAKTEAPKAETFTTEPVTVTLFSNSAGINTEKDLEVLAAPVRKKYPNIKIEQIKGAKIDELITAGEIPDLIATTHSGMMNMLQLGLGSDLNPMVKAKNMDLNRFETEIVKAIKNYGKNGELYGIPYAMNYGVLVYNKDIFNKFGVPYPKDGMTWNELLEVARKVTRSDNGVQYIGWDGGIEVYTRSHAIPLIDEKQEKPLLASVPLQNVFSYLRNLYNIPGIVDEKGKYSYGGVNYFIKDQKLAMYPFWIAGLTSRVQALADGGNNFDWDLAAFPSAEDRKGVGREVEFQSLMVTPMSKNKEAAYRVMEVITSTEVQTELNRDYSLTVLNNLELRKQFAKGLKVYEGKNMAGIFSVKPAPATPITPYDSKLTSFLSEAVKRMVQEHQDVNTVLREANEKAEKYIQDEKTR